MRNKRKIIPVAIMLMLTIVNFISLKGNENIRTIQYISLLSIGALLAILIQSIIFEIKNRN